MDYKLHLELLNQEHFPSTLLYSNNNIKRSSGNKRGSPTPRAHSLSQPRPTFTFQQICFLLYLKKRKKKSEKRCNRIDEKEIRLECKRGERRHGSVSCHQTRLYNIIK